MLTKSKNVQDSTKHCTVLKNAVLRRGRPAPAYSWSNGKNPPKIKFKQFVKLINHTYACNSLTSFKYEVHAVTGNENGANQLKLSSKNS